MIKNENGEKTNEVCNITGINPFEELTLNYDLKMSNIFIFYIVEKKIVYNRAFAYDMHERDIAKVLNAWNTKKWQNWP